MDDSLKQLLILKDMTRRTGTLHEFQITQLKYYPLAVTYANSASFEYDFDKKTIIYYLDNYKGMKPEDFVDRFSFLAKSVRKLLGDEYRVIVKIDQWLAYDTDGKRDRKLANSSAVAVKPPNRLRGKKLPGVEE